MSSRKEGRWLSLNGLSNGLRSSASLLKINALASKMQSVSKAVKTSKGRDQVCQGIQYSADLLLSCYRHSSIMRIQRAYLEQEIKGPLIARNVKHSIKNGRKIFKLLNFLVEFKKIQQILAKPKQKWYIIALVTSRIFQFFYLFFDNILWASKIGKFSQIISGKSPSQIKSLKDIICFVKVSISLCINIYKSQKRLKQHILFKFILSLIPIFGSWLFQFTGFVYIQISKVEKLKQYIACSNHKIIEKNDKYHYICKYFLSQQIKCREDKIRFIIRIFQFVMLSKRVNLPFIGSRIGEIAYATLGLFTVFFDALKDLGEKPKFVRFASHHQKESTPQTN